MTIDLPQNVGHFLRRHRHDLGLSQEALAEQLGYHRTYLGSLERGERNLSLRALADLGERLGVDPREMLQD